MGAVGILVAVPIAAIIKLFYTMFIRREAPPANQKMDGNSDVVIENAKAEDAKDDDDPTNITQ